MRGCYRLHKGLAGAVETQDADDVLEDEETGEEVTDKDMDVDGDDEADTASVPVKKGKGKEKAVAKSKEKKKRAVKPSSPSKPRKRRAKTQDVPAEEEEGEFFDLSNVSSSSSESLPLRPSATQRAARRASKLSPAPRKTSSSRSRSPKRTNVPPPQEIDFFDIKSDEDGLSDALSSLSISSPGLSELEDKILRRKKPPSPPSSKSGRGRPKKAVYVEISD